MKKDNEKSNTLSVKKEDRSSRFVVDLKKTAEEEETAVKRKKGITSNDFFEGLAEFDLPKFLEKTKNLKENFPLFLRSCYRDKNNILKGAEQLVKSSKLPPETKNSLVVSSKMAVHWYDIYGERLKQLAFFNFFKFISVVALRVARWFYRFCYVVGWLGLFLVRFLGLVFYEFISLACFIAYKFYLGVCLSGKFISQFLYVNLRNLSKEFFKKSKIVSTFFSRKAISFFEKLNPAPYIKALGFIGGKIKERCFHFLPKKKNIATKNDFGYRKKNDDYAVREEKMSKKTKFIWWRPIFTFVLVLFVLILPFKIFTYYKLLDLEKLRGKILGVSETAVNDLIVASESAGQLNFNKASYNFSQAGGNFLRAQEQLAEINNLIFALASLVPNEEIKLASESKKILAVGQIASSLGGNLSLALESLFNNKDKDILEVINNFTDYGSKAGAEASVLNNKLKEININALPSRYRENFLALKEGAEILEEGLTEFISLSDKLRTFLGINQDKRYLLVFQNNTELRASGGFIGSFALIDFQGGKIKNIEVPEGGSYDTEGGLRELVAAPEPLSLVNPLWHFWDANWWPDWPTSAKKLMWFYEKSDGPTVDGVISFTPTVLEKILAIIGPIDMTEEYGVTLTAENFWLTTQAIVEEKPGEEEENKPKKIIGDLIDKIIEDLPSLLDRDKLIKFLSLAEENLSEKHILFYFVDQELQEEIEKRGWDGKVRQTNRDYLSVINTNIAGGKTDKKIKETINQVTEIMPNGSIIDTVKIKRTHNGVKGEPFCGVRNVDWLRIYVPVGSELLEAQGFRQPDEIYFEEPEASWSKDPLVYREETTAKIHEASGTKIYNEDNKTVFANWSMVDPGESVTIYLKYKLPFVLKEEIRKDGFMNKIKELINPVQKELFPYTLLVQKQSGSLGSEINTNLKLPANFKIAWKYPKDLPLVDDGWHINDKLNTDKYWAVLLERKD